AGRRGAGDAAPVRTAAVLRPARPVGVDVLRQLPQPAVAEADRGRLRGAVLKGSPTNSDTIALLCLSLPPLPPLGQCKATHRNERQCKATHGNESGWAAGHFPAVPT